MVDSRGGRGQEGFGYIAYLLLCSVLEISMKCCGTVIPDEFSGILVIYVFVHEILTHSTILSGRNAC